MRAVTELYRVSVNTKGSRTLVGIHPSPVPHLGVEPSAAQRNHCDDKPVCGRCAPITGPKDERACLIELSCASHLLVVAVLFAWLRSLMQVRQRLVLVHVSWRQLIPATEFIIDPKRRVISERENS